MKKGAEAPLSSCPDGIGYRERRARTPPPRSSSDPPSRPSQGKTPSWLVVALSSSKPTRAGLRRDDLLRRGLLRGRSLRFHLWLSRRRSLRFLRLLGSLWRRLLLRAVSAVLEYFRALAADLTRAYQHILVILMLVLQVTAVSGSRESWSMVESLLLTATVVIIALAIAYVIVAIFLHRIRP